MTLDDTIIGIAKLPLMDLIHPKNEPFDVPVIASTQSGFLRTRTTTFAGKLTYLHTSLINSQ